MYLPGVSFEEVQALQNVWRGSVVVDWLAYDRLRVKVIHLDLRSIRVITPPVIDPLVP